jgi:hypothetical protein
MRKGYNKTMFKYSIKVFIFSSLTFLVVGTAFVITQTLQQDPSDTFVRIMGTVFPIVIFVILTSFALSVASLLIRFNEKYLSGKAKK